MISLCMIVRDEERNIQQCLESAKNYVDEIIIIDTGSKDNTIDIAKRYTDKIFHIQWSDDFSYPRNFSLEKASGDWILVMDADEKLIAGQEDLKKLIADTKADAYSITIDNLCAPDDVLHQRKCSQIRLFRNKNDYRYSGIIHEQIRSNINFYKGIIKNAPNLVIEHSGYMQDSEEKTKRNIILLTKFRGIHPTDPYINYQMGSQLLQMGKDGEALEHLIFAEHNGDKILSDDTFAMVNLKISQIAMKKNDYHTATKHASKALKFDNGNVSAKYVLVLSLINTGNITKAAEILRDIKAHHLKEISNPQDIVLLLEQIEKAA